MPLESNIVSSVPAIEGGIHAVCRKRGSIQCTIIEGHACSEPLKAAESSAIGGSSVPHGEKLSKSCAAAGSAKFYNFFISLLLFFVLCMHFKFRMPLRYFGVFSVFLLAYTIIINTATYDS